jgi:hypothetical protein
MPVDFGCVLVVVVGMPRNNFGEGSRNVEVVGLETPVCLDWRLWTPKPETPVKES